MTTPAIMVIGVGSPQGDDWVGWELAERLRASEVLAPWSARISISLHDRPGAALLQVWRGGGQVILLDAVRSGAAPGTVHRFDAADLMAQPRQLSTHGFGVADAVQLAAALDALPPSLRFFGVEIDPAHTEMCLSDTVHAALPALVEEIEALMQSWLVSDAAAE